MHEVTFTCMYYLPVPKAQESKFKLMRIKIPMYAVVYLVFRFKHGRQYIVIFFYFQNYSNTNRNPRKKIKNKLVTVNASIKIPFTLYYLLK